MPETPRAPQMPPRISCPVCKRALTPRSFRYRSTDSVTRRTAQVQGRRCNACRLAGILADKTGRRLRNALERGEISPVLGLSYAQKIAHAKALAKIRQRERARRTTTNRWKEHKRGTKAFRTPPPSSKAKF